MVRQRVLILGTVFLLLLCGCNTSMLLKQQKLDFLNAEYDNLQSTDKLLTSSPNPEVLGQASAFVSVGAVNQVLAAADNLTQPIPSVRGAKFHVDSIRASFSDGFPQLEIKNATAQKDDLKLTLTLTAVLEPNIPASDPSKMELRVHILKVIPTVQWSIFHLRLWGFGQEIIHSKLQDYVDALPRFTVPLKASLEFMNLAVSPVLRTSAPAGYVDGVATIPGFDYQGTLVVDRVLFLSDGIHVYASIH